MIEPRLYQSEALEALDNYMMHKEGNPAVVIPTGGGKSVLIAWAIMQWKAAYPPFRVCVLAHRKELVQQNADELRGLLGEWDIGVYSAGLGSRDLDHSVLFASIDSVWNKWGEFPPFDCLIIDEAHRIPAKGEGKYRKFIAGCRVMNKRLKVVGFTATPFRLSSGPICHRDHILNEVCYEANVGDLIADGFLCKLRSKVGAVQPELGDVRRNGSGDFVVASLATAVNRSDLVTRAVTCAVGHIRAENRKSTIWFCVDVEHCNRVSAELRKHGIDAPVVTAKTPSYLRDQISDGVKAGIIQHVCNVNVYSEGFNAKCIDCVVLLRPTLSPGLYYQQVGRGLRLHPGKSDCLVLDFAHCIEEHGPIDCLNAGNVRLIQCGDCGDTFSLAIGECPHCGWKVPKKEVERAEAEDREKRMHEERASQLAILSSQPNVLTVDAVSVHRHSKLGKPDSLRVCYRCGLSTYSEWICLGHGGYAEKDARKWWWKRFGLGEAKSITVDNALQDLFLSSKLEEITKTITVQKVGKYTRIVGCELAHDDRKIGYIETTGA